MTIKNKFIETITISLNDFDHDMTHPVHFISDQRTYIEEYNNISNNLHTNIENLYKSINIILSKNVNTNSIVKARKMDTKYPICYCLYDGYCENCADGTSRIEDTADFCLNCAITKYDNEASDELNVINNITNIININCDTLNINQNYILTKDNIFYVTIEINRSTEDEMIKELKYIFTYLMSGKNGKTIFPNELKHSKASSYPVSAALYTIKNTPRPILCGMLKYQYNNVSSMTINKLENINKSNVISKRPIIKASLFPLWEDKKHHYATEFLKEKLMLITTAEYYGSPVEEFLPNS